MRTLWFPLEFLGCVLAATTSAADLQNPGLPSSEALFDTGRLVQIEIQLDPKDWHALRISHPIVDEGGDISMTEKGYHYYRGDVIIDGRHIHSVGVRKKGSWGSIISSRPSLKIRFDKPTKNQEFSGLDMVTLNNLVSDPTKAQQLLAYSFMERAGVPAPRSNLARVVVNGEDLGIYGQVEPIRKPFLRRFFAQADGDLYEPGESGDLKTKGPYGLNRIVLKSGHDHNLEHLRRLADVLETPGGVALPRIEELIDLDAFITFWAAGVLVGHSDGYAANRHNYFIYRDAKSERLYFIPWGVDAAFEDNPKFYDKPVPRSVKAAGLLCQRLWELPEIREQYRKEMRRLLADVWDEKAMLANLDRIRILCREDRTETAEKVRKGIDQTVRFIKSRRKEIQAELDGPAPDWPTIPSQQVPVAGSTHGPPMKVEGTFSASVAELFTTNLFGNGSATLEFIVDGETHKPFARAGAAAAMRPWEFGNMMVVEIMAAAASGELTWRVTFRIDPYRLAPGVNELNPFNLGASVVQGKRPHAQFRYPQRNTGTLELTQVSTNLGGIISGKFQINTTAFAEEKQP